MRAVPGAQHSANQQGAALSVQVFDCRYLPILIPPNGFPVGGLVGLHEDATPHRVASDIQPQIAQQGRA